MYYGHYIILIILWLLYQIILIISIIASDMALIHLYLVVIPDDDLGLISEEREQQTSRSHTPPTLDHHQPSLFIDEVTFHFRLLDLFKTVFPTATSWTAISWTQKRFILSGTVTLT